MPSTQFYRTGLRHCPNIGGADVSGGREGSYAVNPNLYRCRCTAGCPPINSVIKCRCVRQIVQKGLAFGRHWSGTVGQFRAPRAPRDPVPPAPSPRWGFGGAARRRGTERGISMSKSSKKGPRASAPAAVPTAKPSRHTARDAAPNKAACRPEAIARHRDAAIAHRGDDCGDDEGHRLAVALGARVSRRRGAQAP